MATTEENAGDIKCIEQDMAKFKDNYYKEHQDQAVTMSAMATTLKSIDRTLEEMKADQKNINDTLVNIVPTVHNIAEIEIPNIKKEQEESKQFRWRTIGITSVLSVIAIAVVSGVVTFTFKQCESDKYVKRDEIRNIYKFSESLKVKEAEASQGTKQEIYETNP